MQLIPITNLLYMLMPVALLLVLMWRWSGQAGTSIYALARMILQLVMVGYVLTTIFDTDHYTIVLLVLTIMLIVSAWISLRPVAQQRRELYVYAIAATTCVNSFILILVTHFVLETKPWYAPDVVIPLAGMIFSAGMNGISLFAERFFSERQSLSSPEAERIAFRAAMIPIMNSLFAVGLVALPGMMTGQILSGVSPLIAVRYQIVVMMMLFSSTGLTAALFMVLVRYRYAK